MQRSKLIRRLEAYAVRFPDEAATAVRFREFVGNHSDCFERTCLPGHVTASAWIVHPDREKVLLTHHRKLDRWLQPGGHSDGDADSLAVALREAREESGLDLVLFPTDHCGSVVAGAFLGRRGRPGSGPGSGTVTPLPRAATQSGARPRPPEGRAHKRTSASLRSLTVSRYAFGIAPCICTLVGTLIRNYQLERALVAHAPRPMDIDIHEIPARGSERAHLHYDLRYALKARSEAFTVSEESHDLAWVPFEALETFTTEESVLRMRRKWLELNRTHAADR